MQLEVVTTKPPAEARPTPLLFIHGAWHGAWCWTEHFLPYFAQHNYISHALSLRGHGNSEDRKRLRWTRLADYVADVDQVVSQLEKPPVLIGHSMGGLIVQKYLETHQMPAAVLLAPVPPTGVLPTTLRLARQHPLAFVKANLTLSLYPIIGSPELTREAFFSQDMPRQLVDKYFASMQDESYLAFLDMLGLDLPQPKKVETPLLVLGAARDTMFYPSEVEATAHAYNAEAEIFPDMAHDMMLEDGWQSVADRIISWLKEQGL